MFLIKNLSVKVNNCINKRLLFTSIMAKSKYEYVKGFETDDKLLPNCWIVVRVDGKGFHKFCKLHDFDKPNDEKALNLMNVAGMTVMKEFNDIILSYGQSDEYSFVFHKSSQLYNRRATKIASYVNSLFTSAYVFNWNNLFPEKKLNYPPCFDSRTVLYPTEQNLKDYLSWRQADVHINNLYNTAFWNLVLKGGLTNSEAEAELRGTLSADKNEILFNKFGINYNKISPMFRKGTILLRKKVDVPNSKSVRQLIVPIFDDLIQEKFWKTHHELLEKKTPQRYEVNEVKEGDGEVVELPELVLMQLENIRVN